MIQTRSERKTSESSLNLIEISFNLKQCTLFHNKFGCYSFDLKYGNTSKRSPTINILKEKVNLDVIISFKDIPYEGDDICISLYNQMLVKNKQNDVLISQQILNLSKFKAINQSSKQDQFLTFEKDGQLKASVKYILQVNDLREEEVDQGERKFIVLLKQWMKSTFLQSIIKQVENEERRQGDEERLKKLKQQQEEILRKKREEEESKRNIKNEEDNEKKKIESQKKLEDLTKLKQLQQEREQREREKLQKEKSQREEEEKEKQRQQKIKQKEERIKQKRRELEQEEQIRQVIIKQKQAEEHNELKQYEDEGFEDYEEHRKVQQNISTPEKMLRYSDKASRKQQNNDEIQEELVGETEDQNRHQSQVNVSSHYIRQPKSRQVTSFQMQAESYQANRVQSRDNSKDRSFLDRSGMKQKSNQKIEKRNMMSLLKQWMSKLLRKIIRQTSFVDRLNYYTSSFFIFGDETFPYILIFDPFQQQLDRISLPKSLTMYRYSQAVALPNGKIFICGGVNSKLNNILPFCQLYDPYINKGYPMPNMHYARYTHSSIYFHDYVYVVGGRTYGNGESSILNSFERFSLKYNKWEKLAPLQDGRCTASLIGLQEKKWLYLIGGFSPKGRLNQIERYNIEDNNWKILSIKLPACIEAGIVFSVQGSGDTFYFMFGRGDDDRNEQIYKIQVSPTNPEQDSVNVVGRVKKGRVLPSSFVDQNQNLFVFGGDENAWEKFDIPSFQSKYGKKSAADLLPIDMKIFCSALSQIEIPRKPALRGLQDAFYIHIIVVDLDQSLKQFKSGKEQSTSTSSKIQLSRQISNFSCQLINSNYMLLFGGVYSQTTPNTPLTNTKMPSSKQQSQQLQMQSTKQSLQSQQSQQSQQKQTQQILQQKQQQNLIQEETNIKLSKECYVYSLHTKQILQLSPSLEAKRNSATFLINQMIYSFGGEKTVNGKVEVSTSVERFHLRQNRWERLCELPQGISQSCAFQYGKRVYLIGGINNEKTFNNVIYEYDLQYDYFISGTKKLLIPIEFKHTIQFYDSSKLETPFVLLFSASFKQQGILNLTTSTFHKTEILPIASYPDDEKRVLRVSQEKQYISFILPNRIDIYGSTTSYNNSSPDDTCLPTFELKKVKDIPLQGGKQSSTVQKEQIVPIRNIFMTRYVDRRMEFLDFLEFNENKSVLRKQSSSDGQSINSANKIDDIAALNGLQCFPNQEHQNNSITCMYEDNEGQIRLIKQEVYTGWEEEIALNANSKGNLNIFKKSVLSFDNESGKVILTGGVQGRIAIANIIEVDINKNKITQIQEMITPRYNHCQILVNNFLYMIGGCNNTQITHTSKNNSPSLPRLNNHSNSSKTTQSLLFDKYPSLTKNSNSLQDNVKLTSLMSINNKNMINKTDKLHTKVQSASTSNIPKMSQLSAQKLNPSIEHILSEDENIEENLSHNNLENAKDSSEGRASRNNQHSSSSSQRLNNFSSSKGRVQTSSVVVLRKVDRLNLRNNEIEQVTDLPHPVMNASCCQLRGAIYVIGGKDTLTSVVDIVQKYEIASNTWQIASFKLWEPLHSVSCLAAGFNQIIIFGGINSVDHSVRDIQVLDPKAVSTKKVAASSINNLPPLLQPHTSCQMLVGKEIYLFDKNHIQCMEMVSNFDSYSVKEISPISRVEQLRDCKQIYGIFSSELADNCGLSRQWQYSGKQYDTITMFGNEKNGIKIEFDMKVQRFKVSEVGVKSQELLEWHSACFSDYDNSIIISGGISSSQKISSNIIFYKNYKFLQAKPQLFLPRFLHTSVYLSNKLYLIGGKSYSNQSSKQSNSCISSNSLNNSSVNSSDDKQIRHACTSECEVYDLTTQEISKIAQLNFPRSNIQAIVLNDCIYVFGGFGGDKKLRSIEKYIPSDDKWEIIDCYLNSDLENYQLCKFSPFEALIVGGKENGQNSAKIYIFNAKFHTLTIASFKLNSDFSAFKCAVYNDELFIFGICQKEAVVISYNLRNGFEDTKLPVVSQLSLLEASWSSTLTKSY